MKILQIDDKEEYWLKEADSVTTFEEAKEKIQKDEYDVFIIDGRFPLDIDYKPEVNANIVIEYLKTRNIKGKIIVWANSIRAQKYCKDNNILCFSKKEKTEEHIKKMRKYGLESYAEVRNKENILK